jgi:undecaprenyl-diphosphatase
VRQTRSSGPHATRYPAHRVLLVVLAGLAGVLTVLVAAAWAPLMQVDEAVAQAVNVQMAARPALVDVVGVVTDIGSETAVRVLTGLVVVAALLLRRYRAAAYVLICWVVEYVVENGLKHVIGRERPVVPVEFVHATTGSYPSGHAMAITVLAVSVVVLLVGLVDRRWWRWLLMAGAAAVIVAVAVSRVLLGVHYPSDVVGAMLLGTLLSVVLVPVVGVPAFIRSRSSGTGSGRR